MSREKSVSSTRRIALASTLSLLLVSLLLNGCIFSPEKKVIQNDLPTAKVPEKPEDLIQNLAAYYQQRKINEFAGLLANDPANKAEYLFITAPSSTNPTPEQWGYTEEVRLHQRMFEPENTLPGQTPVPTDYWLVSLNISLLQETPFMERTDLYASALNPDGLDPAKWKAEEANYGTDVFFDLQGEIDFQVNGRAAFVVITDLTKNIGDEGKFLILQWQDLANTPKPSAHLAS